MNKKYILIALLAGTSLIAIHAQHDVLSAGGDFSSAGGSVAFSIGQIGYTYQTGESGSASLGVQQPYFFNIVATDDPDQQWAITLYPNPADQLVYVDLKDDIALKQFKDLQIRLFDLQGKLMAEKDITEIITPFPLTSLTEAIYILQIGQEQKTLKSFKLYKSN